MKQPPPTVFLNRLTARSLNDLISAPLQEALKDAFNVFDKDGSGLLDKNKFNAILRSPQWDGGLSDQQLDKMLASIPYDKEGKIGQQDFVNFVMNSSGDE